MRNVIKLIENECWFLFMLEQIIFFDVKGNRITI